MALGITNGKVTSVYNAGTISHPRFVIEYTRPDGQNLSYTMSTAPDGDPENLQRQILTSRNDHDLRGDSQQRMVYRGTAIINIEYVYVGKRTNIQLQSIISCPVCGHQKEETMPVNACQFFYKCEHCKARIKPKDGDCCVFCSYGTVKCPPMQSNNSCCN